MASSAWRSSSRAGLAGQFTRRHHVAVEAVHYYWHFVDVVWILLFLVLYVMK